MSHHRPASSAWPSHGYQDMYDDRPYEDQPTSYSARSHQHSRKDHERTPPRGDSREDMYVEHRGRQDFDKNRRRSRSPDREQRRRYTSQHDEDYSYQSPQDRSRSRSPRGITPNATVILDGTMDLTQEDVGRPIPCLPLTYKIWTLAKHRVGRFGRCETLQIINELQNRLQVEGIEEIRLIKDRRTGQSRRFAFAQFVGIPEATQFLNKFYPVLSLYAPYDPAESGNVDGIKVRIAYCREREDREKNAKGDDDWKCEVCYVSNFAHRSLCFRCNAPRTRSTANGIVVQAMSSHAGLMTTGESDASPDGTASQFILIRGLEPGANEELLAKGVSKLYKAKPSTEIAESRAKKPKISSTTDDASLGAKDGSLRRVLLMRDRKSGESWRYGFAEFNTVEDAQAAMTKFRTLEKFTISSKPVSISYIHAGVFVPVLQTLDEDLKRFTFSPLSNTAIRLMYWDEAAYASELVVAIVDQALITSKKNKSEHARLAAAARNEGLVQPGKDGEPRTKKRKVEKDNKIVAPHLQFWTNQHAELHGNPTKEPAIENASSGATEKIESVEAPQFTSLQRKCCFLCSRQFKTEAEVDKHSRLSQLHRDNLKNQELVNKATAKMNKSVDPNVDGSAYRDRAKERRTAFNQPKQPTAQHNRPSKDKTPEEEITAPIQSKGAALLGKMGWSVGEGLGATGSGRTEAITTHLYSQGVGLGATGGKVGDAVEEAERQTKGTYSDFLNKSKEKAHARFHTLE